MTKKDEDFSIGRITFDELMVGDTTFKNVSIEHDDPEEERKHLKTLLNSAPSPAVSSNTSDKNIVLSELAEKFAEDKEADKSWEKTSSEQRGLLKRIILILGDVPVRSIEYEQARLLRGVLKKLPPHFAVSRKYTNLSIKQLINQEHSKTLTDRTINKTLMLAFSI